MAGELVPLTHSHAPSWPVSTPIVPLPLCHWGCPTGDVPLGMSQWLVSRWVECSRTEANQEVCCMY